MSQSEPPAPQSPGPVPQFLLGTPSTPQRLVPSAPESAGQIPEQPSPPSSSGSNKRLADPDISELVRKAKASRYNNQPPKRNDDECEDLLETDLSCAICSEVLANPVACLDCLHKFCGSCLVPWFERSDTCPTCRQTVKGTRDEHLTSSIIEKLLNRFPDKKRDPGELEELRLIYKPGQKINITNTYSDEDDEPEAEEEDDGGITWLPCPCCTTPNAHGFTCPDPIPPPDPIRGPQRADVYSYRSHHRCQSCPNYFPTVWKSGWKCENCGVFNCGNLFDCNVRDFLMPVSNLATNLHPSMYTVGLGPASHNANPINIRAFTNPTERSLFTAWMTTSGLSWQDVGQRIYNFLLAKNANLIPFSAKHLRPEEFACQQCMMMALSNNFLSWWINERESTGYADNRGKCWYGRECRTQTHNTDHARRLCHACEVTPRELRRNDALAVVPGRGAAEGDGGNEGNGNDGGGDGGGIGGVGGNDGAADEAGGNNDGQVPQEEPNGELN